MDDKEMNDLFEKLRSDVLNKKEKSISKTQLEEKEIVNKGKKSPVEKRTDSKSENGNKEDESTDKLDQTDQNEIKIDKNDTSTHKSEETVIEVDNCEQLAPDILNESTSSVPPVSPAPVTVPLNMKHKQIKVSVKRANLTEIKMLQSNDKGDDKSFKMPNTPVKRKSTEVSSTQSKEILETKKTSVLNATKVTPTKAQQKLFDPKLLGESELLKQYNCKKVEVKLKRSNLLDLLNKTSIKNKKSKTTSPPKRKSNTPTPEVSPVKKARRSVSEKDTKSNFFIKLSPKLDSNKDASLTAKNVSSGKSPTQVKSSKSQKPKSIVKKVGSNERAQKENPKLSVRPTKFTRTFLEKTYGKRCFQLRVKMEKFTHPILVEFNAKSKAAKREAREKKKNLSVSFKDQVEIFGISDSESDVELNTTPTTTKETENNAPHMPVTPSKLIKTENGKVVDTIDLDSTLFLDPKEAVASTPLQTRKKHDKKSFSPLKDEGLTSPRKEQLKLADEKIPPKDLRCLGSGEAEDDDEDVEYIVPFEVPPRTSTKPASDADIVDVAEQADSEMSNNNENKENENKQNEKKDDEGETSGKKSPQETVNTENDSKPDSSTESFATAGNASDNEEIVFIKLNNGTNSLLNTCNSTGSNENKTTSLVPAQEKISDNNKEIKDSNAVQIDLYSEDSEITLRVEDEIPDKQDKQDAEKCSEDDHKDSEKVSNDDSTETHPPEPDSAADPETDDEALKNSKNTTDKEIIDTPPTMKLV